MKSLSPLIPLIATALLLAACGGTSPERQGIPEVFQEESLSAMESQPLPDPKINILFVVDNSGSMQNYQTLLSQNIEKFTNTFFNNTRLDYKIGVVPVYDSKFLNDKKVYGTAGIRKMNPLGELVELKGVEPTNKKQVYITRDTPNAKEVLKKTVLIGTQWGPEAEESFSPVLAITNKEINSEINQNFYDEDAYLAVIFITDADDVTRGLSAESFYQRLVDLKKGNAEKVLIAAALPKLSNNSENCVKDGRGPVQSFPSLLAVSGGIEADLCSENFGEELASFGKQILNRVGRQVITLPATPDIDSLKVFYAVKGAPDSERQYISRSINGYMLDPDKDQIIISPELKLTRVQGGEIQVVFKPVNYKNFQNGRLKQYGK